MEELIYANGNYGVRVHNEGSSLVSMYAGGPIVHSWYEVVNKATGVVEAAIFSLPEAMSHADALDLNLTIKPWAPELERLRQRFLSGDTSELPVSIPPFLQN